VKLNLLKGAYPLAGEKTVCNFTTVSHWKYLEECKAVDETSIQNLNSILSIPNHLLGHWLMGSFTGMVPTNKVSEGSKGILNSAGNRGTKHGLIETSIYVGFTVILIGRAVAQAEYNDTAIWYGSGCIK
jgi:hypothetical protein